MALLIGAAATIPMTPGIGKPASTRAKVYRVTVSTSCVINT